MNLVMVQPKYEKENKNSYFFSHYHSMCWHAISIGIIMYGVHAYYKKLHYVYLH